MRSKFSILGHPIHPILVTIPIGLFILALVADIVYVARDHDRMWYDIAFWSGLFAWTSALIAALPGFGDYLTMARKSDANAIAMAHMTLNVTIVILYIVATALAMDSGATSGGVLGAVIALHAVGTGLLLLSGWLGGEMVYRHHLAVIPDTAELEAGERERHETAPGAKPFRPASDRR